MSSGQVETYVVAGDVTPTWAQGSPACHTEGRHYVAILSEVGLCGGSNHSQCVLSMPCVCIWFLLLATAASTASAQ